MENIFSYYIFFLYLSYFLIYKREIHIKNEKIQKLSTLSTPIRVRVGVLKKIRNLMGRECSVEYFYWPCIFLIKSFPDEIKRKPIFQQFQPHPGVSSTPKGWNFFSLISYNFCPDQVTILLNYDVRHSQNNVCLDPPPPTPT